MQVGQGNKKFCEFINEKTILTAEINADGTLHVYQEANPNLRRQEINHEYTFKNFVSAINSLNLNLSGRNGCAEKEIVPPMKREVKE